MADVTLAPGARALLKARLLVVGGVVGAVQRSLALDVVREELLVLLKRNVPLGLLLLTLALLVFLDFKFVGHVAGAAVRSLQVGEADVVVDAVFFSALVKGVDHVGDHFLLLHFVEVLLDFLAQCRAFLLLSPLFLDAVLVVLVAPLLVLGKGAQRLAVEVSLAHVLHEAGGVANELAFNGVDDGTFVLVGEAVATDDLQAR